MSSTKKTKANRENARQSSWPKTLRGKKNSARNAWKHGLFARDLKLSESEKSEIQTFREELLAQCKPNTALQNVALDAIVHCVARLRRAADVENRALEAFGVDSQDRSVASISGPELARWYLADRQGVRAGIRLLSGLKADFACKGRIDAQWRDALDTNFGPAFYSALTEWSVMNPETLKVARHFENQQKSFGWSFPSMSAEPTVEVVRDPEQTLQLIKKLIDQKLADLTDLLRGWEARADESGAQVLAAADFGGRCFAAANRDLHRNVKWFLYLRHRRL